MSRHTHYVVSSEPISARKVLTSLCGVAVKIPEELAITGDLQDPSLDMSSLVKPPHVDKVPKPLKRTRIKKTRTKLRPGRLSKLDMEKLRMECFVRDEFKCVDCGRRVRWDGVWWETGHMAHIVSRGRGGKDELPNVKTKCHYCHIVVEHSGGKPCPAKESL